MRPDALTPGEHSGCGAQIGELHERGCDVERCARCGGQVITCPCVYELNGMDPDELEAEHPDIYKHGPTAEMLAVYDAEIERLGGRIPRGPLYPGVEDAVRLNLWCRWVEEGSEDARLLGRAGWCPCDREHPDAEPDLNMLARCTVWNRERRRYELPNEGEVTDLFAAAASVPKHPVRLMGLTHSEAARRIADMDYAELWELLDELGHALVVDAVRDGAAGRPRLYDGLLDAAQHMHCAARIFNRLAALQPSPRDKGHDD